MTLQDMELSIRSYNCLHNDGLETAGEIDAKTDRELLCLANFGRRSLWEVREVIKYLKGEYNEFDEKVAAK
jgi:DNA-directed RNA polymerase subunit alpha